MNWIRERFTPGDLVAIALCAFILFLGVCAIIDLVQRDQSGDRRAVPARSAP